MVLNEVKPKYTQSTNATAACFGKLIKNYMSNAKLFCYAATSGISLRGGMAGFGSGRGPLMLLPTLGSASSMLWMKTKANGMTCNVYGTGSSTSNVDTSSTSHAVLNNTTTASIVKQRQVFSLALLTHATKSSQKDVFLHKRQVLFRSQAKCCFASPVSERTACGCCNPSGNLLSLRLQTSLSTSSSPSFVLTPWVSTRLLSLVGIDNRVNINFNQFRTFVTSPSCWISTTSEMASNGSLCRQNFHEDCEANINKQINMELYASYVYMSMAYYFEREDVSFPGLHKFFKKASDEEREHAEKFMKYQNTRGGRIVLQPIAKPTQDEWASPLDAMSAALELEKTVNQTLLDLHRVASDRNDPQLCDFLESNYLEEQVHAIKELSEYVTRLRRVGKGLGEYLFDKDLNKAE